MLNIEERNSIEKCFNHISKSTFPFLDKNPDIISPHFWGLVCQINRYFELPKLHLDVPWDPEGVEELWIIIDTPREDAFDILHKFDDEYFIPVMDIFHNKLNIILGEYNESL